jgi:hypothetical protein
MNFEVMRFYVRIFGCEILAVMNRSVLQGLFKAQLRVFAIALLNGP